MLVISGSAATRCSDRGVGLSVVWDPPRGFIAVQGKQDAAVKLGCTLVEMEWVAFYETVVSWIALSFTERKWFLPPLNKTKCCFAALCWLFLYFIHAIRLRSVHVGGQEGAEQNAVDI